MRGDRANAIANMQKTIDMAPDTAGQGSSRPRSRNSRRPSLVHDRGRPLTAGGIRFEFLRIRNGIGGGFRAMSGATLAVYQTQCKSIS